VIQPMTMPTTNNIRRWTERNPREQFVRKNKPLAKGWHSPIL
jgi:hypothetical protein